MRPVINSAACIPTEPEIVVAVSHPPKWNGFDHPLDDGNKPATELSQSTPPSAMTELLAICAQAKLRGPTPIDARPMATEAWVALAAKPIQSKAPSRMFRFNSSKPAEPNG